MQGMNTIRVPVISTTQYFFFKDPAPPEIYTWVYTLSLHDALPICKRLLSVTAILCGIGPGAVVAAKNQARSEEHTSDLQSQSHISYAVFCLKKKKKKKNKRKYLIKIIKKKKNIKKKEK